MIGGIDLLAERDRELRAKIPAKIKDYRFGEKVVRCRDCQLWTQGNAYGGVGECVFALTNSRSAVTGEMMPPYPNAPRYCRTFLRSPDE